MLRVTITQKTTAYQQAKDASIQEGYNVRPALDFRDMRFENRLRHGRLFHPARRLHPADAQIRPLSNRP